MLLIVPGILPRSPLGNRMNLELDNYYQWRECLRADAPSYVERSADQELLEKLKIGEYCYVLNASQMGKSSLMLRTKHKLEQQGFACAAISLKTMSQVYTTYNSWYEGLFNDLANQFKLSEQFNCKLWWDQQKDTSLNKLLNFIDTILLTEINHNKIVILFDEIDIIFRVRFRVDDFFTFISTCYQRRAVKSAYNSLNFALFGVAALSALNTKLNIIGRTIELTGFKLSETKPLAYGLQLAKKVKHPKNVLKEILKWTGGQPYLTQIICGLVIKSKLYIHKGQEVEKIATLVNRHVIDSWETKDAHTHLENIQLVLLRNNPSKFRRLTLYQKILQEGEVGINYCSENSPEQIELQLSGVVVKEQENLKLFNQIYKHIFNEEWVSKNLAEISLLYTEKLSNWLASQEQDESQLLYGQELEKVWKWAKEKKLTEQERNFLLKSQLFDAVTKVRLCSINNYESVVQAVFSWTRGEKKLNDLILELAKFHQLPAAGSEAIWVDNLVRSHILDNWQTHVANHPIAEFRHQLLLVHIEKLKMVAEKDKINIVKIFQEWIPELEQKSSRLYSHLIEEILLWTKPNLYLLETLCQLICDSQTPIPINHEAEYIQQLVQTHWISQWETQPETQPIREMSDRLLKNPNCDPFRLLIRYRQILREELLLEDDNQEDEELLKIKLVDKINGNLRVANFTYEHIFNLSWINQSLTNISRPYEPRKFINWLDSRQKDKSQLLIGEELEKTKAWADTNKDLLTDQERDFITWSIIANF